MAGLGVGASPLLCQCELEVTHVDVTRVGNNSVILTFRTAARVLAVFVYPSG